MLCCDDHESNINSTVQYLVMPEVLGLRQLTMLWVKPGSLSQLLFFGNVVIGLKFVTIQKQSHTENVQIQ